MPITALRVRLISTEVACQLGSIRPQWCIGAPIRDYTGNVVAALSIAGPVFRIPKGRIAAFARAVTAVADKLSADLGYLKPLARNRRQVS